MSNIERNIDAMIGLPTTLKDFRQELQRLNDNLEKMPEALEEIRQLTEVLEDLREMLAPLLGFIVVEKKGEGHNNK